LASVAAKDGPGGAAVGAERGAGVAGADPVGAVHEAVARQAEPGGVGAAVDRRRRGSAVVAGRRRRAGAGAGPVAAGLHLAGPRSLALLRLRLRLRPLRLMVPARAQHLVPLVVLTLTHAVGLAMTSASELLDRETELEDVMRSAEWRERRALFRFRLPRPGFAWGIRRGRAETGLEREA